MTVHIAVNVAGGRATPVARLNNVWPQITQMITEMTELFYTDYMDYMDGFAEGCDAAAKSL